MEEKIAIVTGFFPKISETFVLDHITGLILHGVDVSVIALSPGKNIDIFEHEDFHKFQLRKKTIFCNGDMGRFLKLKKMFLIFLRRPWNYKRLFLKILFCKKNQIMKKF